MPQLVSSPHDLDQKQRSMAITALEAAWAGWVITVVGWLLSPVIALLLPKILSCLGFDRSQKLRQLKIQVIPELESTLRAVDQARMMRRGEVSDVSTLDDMAAMLRHAREDAEDILDDAQEIESYRNRWPQRLYGAVKARIIAGYGAVARCLGILSTALADKLGHPLDGAMETCKSSFMWLLQRARKIFALPRSQEDVLPVTTRSDAASDEPIPVATRSDAASDDTIAATSSVGASEKPPVPVTTSDEPPVPVAAPSDSSVWCLSCFCTFVDFIENGIAYVFEFACFIRDWPYEQFGITGDQGKATALDFVLSTIVRSQLKKKIDDVHSTVSDVKKSPLFVKASKTAMDDIANENRSRIITSIDHEVFGREALRKIIMAKLKKTGPSSSTSRCYSVIGIYGVAGSGKTTFARYTRDYIEKECKKDKLFDTVMCIHLSQTFSVDNVFHEMLKDITKDRHSNISDRGELEEKLKESLCGKCFFLILDDLWVKTTTDSKLRELITPLIVGKEGSKVLVTARTKVAAGVLGADELIKMPDLDEEQYLSMFMHYALGRTSVIDEEFIRVGSVIAEKLRRSPIAAVIVAGQLGANRDISFWKNTAERDMLNDTMDALWWSYQQLSPDIRRCFEYCNIFPRRFEMKKGDLVHLWIAQGFVKNSYAREDMEDVAESYIQELVSCSFLQPEKTWNGEESCFTIHDLLHDLADMVTGTDCFRIENESRQRGERWKGDIPRDVRHLFVQNYDAELITKEILGFGNLRTLIINVVGRDTQVEEKIIDIICKKLPKLRVLYFAVRWELIRKPTKVSVPESVSQLKYLRYLAFRTTIDCTITLPSTLNKLQHIQHLDFGDGYISEFTFAELVNLRRIFCGEFAKLPYAGRLSSLQTLPGFKVSDEQGCELKQLRDLNKLRGKLHISGLENVKSMGNALETNLAGKRLNELALLWGYSNHTRCSPEAEADVLEGLCPPVGLQILRLHNFVGCRYPDWMVCKQNGGPKYLQELYFVECSPAPQLVEAFPRLHVLCFWDCGWDALPDNMEHLTSLKQLVIGSCKNIRSLPTLPQSLEAFLLRICNVEFMESCRTVGHPNWEKIKHIPSQFIR